MNAILSFREQRHLRAARVQQRRQLERELATYTSPAELDDLYAALEEYHEADVADVRAILDRQRVA